MNLWVKHVLTKHQNLNFIHKIHTRREVIVHRASAHLLKAGSRACKITSCLCSAKELLRSLLCLIMGLKGETAWILCIANNWKRCTGACITNCNRKGYSNACEQLQQKKKMRTLSCEKQFMLLFFKAFSYNPN